MSDQPDTGPRMIRNGPDCTPTEAVLKVLNHVNFDERVPKGKWVAVTIIGNFESTGAAFHNMTIKEVDGEGDRGAR